MRAALAALVLCSARASAQSPLDAILDRELPSLEELYRELHASPELSYHEEKTAARMATEMRKAGFDVSERFGAYEDPARTCHGVVGVLRNGEGPTVLLRADMDALPVLETATVPFASRARGKDDDGADVPVMHACGHDIHMTALVGAARALAAMKDRWKGTLLLVAQPAEERAPGGADAMLRGGLYSKFPKPTVGLALHCDPSRQAGKVAWVSGAALANVDTVDVTVRGVGGHGAYPNAAKDPVVLAAQIVLSLQTIVSREIPPGDPAVVTVGSIHGGTRHNVIPGEVTLEITTRSYTAETRQRVLKAIERIALHTARAAGVPPDREPIVALNPEQHVPSTYNDPALTARSAAAMREALGPENVEPADPVMGGEDFGHFSLPDRSVPCFMLWLGAVDAKRIEASRRGAPLPSLHSGAFAPAVAPAVRTGVKALVACALDAFRPR